MPDYTKPPYIKYTRSDQPNNDIYTTPDILSAPATPGFNNGLTNEQMLKNSGWIPATSSNPSTTPNPTQTSPSVSELAKNPNFALRSDPFLDQLKQDASKTVDPEAIRQQEMDRIQEQINAIRGVYANEIAAANREGEGRLGSQRAIAARSGLIGSDFGEAQKAKVEGYNRDVVNGINSRMSADIAAIFQKAQDRASERIKLETDQKRMDRDEYLKRLDKLTADSRADLSTLAQSGVSYDQLDEATKKLMGEQTGFGAATKQIFDRLAQQSKKTVELNGGLYELQSDGSYKLVAGGNKATSPVEVSPGSSLYDPTTGKFIGTAPGKEVLPPSAQEYEYAVKNGYKGSYIDYQNQDANRKAQVAKVTAGGLNSVQQNAAFKLADDYEKASGDLGKVISNYNRVVASSKDPSPAGDLSLIFSYMKTLDPTSVVREGEFATASNAGSVGDKLINQYNKIINGERLTDAQRKDFVSRSTSLYQSAINQQKQIDKTFSDRANKFGIPPDYVIRTQNSYNDNQNDINQGISDQEMQALRQEFPNMSDQQIRQQLGFNQPLSMGENGLKTGEEAGALGSLSKKYESSGNPGAIGYDSTGGYSYGTYQLAHNSAQNFINQSPFKPAFDGLTFNSPEWRQRWKEIAQIYPSEFAQAQEEYAKNNWYEPLAKKAEQIGVNLDNYSPVLKDVIFSTAIQHGAGTDVINKALAKVGKNASEADLIKAIYDERWSNGNRFSTSTPQVKQAVYNRFFGKNGELNTALSLLN